MTDHSKLVLGTIASRHCKRAFLDKKIPKDVITTVLDSAKNAPSSKNSQPWQIEIVTGDSLKHLRTTLCDAFDNNVPTQADYVYMTDPMPTLFKDRAKACGYALYDLKQISKDDTEARRAHFRENYCFFNAPLAMIFHLHEHAERGNFLDLGCLLQNVLVGLCSVGLGSCPQFSVAGYPKQIKNNLNIPQNRIIVCGLSIGYPDPSAPVNTFIPKRENTENFCNWHQ